MAKRNARYLKGLKAIQKMEEQAARERGDQESADLSRDREKILDSMDELLKAAGSKVRVNRQ